MAKKKVTPKVTEPPKPEPEPPKNRLEMLRQQAAEKAKKDRKDE